jgi:hypothetical protein
VSACAGVLYGLCAWLIEKGMSLRQGFNEAEFRDRVERALVTVRTVLDNTRNPTYPADVPHRYDDKYLLAEYLTNTATASVLNALDAIGLTSKGMCAALWD